MTQNTSSERGDRLNRKIWNLAQAGMPMRSIGNAVSLSVSTVSRRLERMRRRAYDYLEVRGEAEITGEKLLHLRFMREEAFRGVKAAPEGSSLRIQWLEEVRRIHESELRFLRSVNLIRNAPERVQVDVMAIQTMSPEELERERRLLQKQLLETMPDVPAGISMDDGFVIDAEVLGSGPGSQSSSGEPDDAADRDDLLL